MPGAGSGADEETPWDMKVEIQGVIYIINPPDRSKVGIEETTDAGAEPAGAASGEKPVAKNAADDTAAEKAATKSTSGAPAADAAPAAPGDESQGAVPAKAATPAPAGGPVPEKAAPPKTAGGAAGADAKKAPAKGE